MDRGTFAATGPRSRRRPQQTIILLLAAAIAYVMETRLGGACWLIAFAAAYALIDAARWARIGVACVALFAFPIMLMGDLLEASVLR